MVAELTYLLSKPGLYDFKTYVSPVLFFLFLISLSFTFIKEVKPKSLIEGLCFTEYQIES